MDELVELVIGHRPDDSLAFLLERSLSDLSTYYMSVETMQARLRDQLPADSVSLIQDSIRCVSSWNPRISVTQLGATTDMIGVARLYDRWLSDMPVPESKWSTFTRELFRYPRMWGCQPCHQAVIMAAHDLICAAATYATERKYTMAIQLLQLYEASFQQGIPLLGTSEDNLLLLTS